MEQDSSKKVTSGRLHRPSGQVYAAKAVQERAGSPACSSSHAAAYPQLQPYPSTETLPREKRQSTRRHFKQAPFKAGWLGPAHQMVSPAQHVPRAEWVLLGHLTTSSTAGKHTFQKARGYSLHISHRKGDSLRARKCWFSSSNGRSQRSKELLPPTLCITEVLLYHSSL